MQTTHAQSYWPFNRNASRYLVWVTFPTKIRHILENSFLNVKKVCERGCGRKIFENRDPATKVGFNIELPIVAPVTFI